MRSTLSWGLEKLGIGSWEEGGRGLRVCLCVGVRVGGESQVHHEKFRWGGRGAITGS